MPDRLRQSGIRAVSIAALKQIDLPFCQYLLMDKIKIDRSCCHIRASDCDHSHYIPKDRIVPAIHQHVPAYIDTIIQRGKIAQSSDVLREKFFGKIYFAKQ
jgi:hypothetical protein